jgi:cytoskeletal protein RodZ
MAESDDNKTEETGGKAEETEAEKTQDSTDKGKREKGKAKGKGKGWKIALGIFLAIVILAAIGGQGGSEDTSGSQQESQDSQQEQQATEQDQQETTQEETVTVDKSSLEASIQSSEGLSQGDYTAETWEPFSKALEAAKTVDADASATQAEVDSAASELSSASSALKEAFKPENYAQLDYKSVARTPDDFKGKKVVLSGRVAQVVEGDTETDLRVATNGSYDDMVLVGFSPDIMGGTHILEDDTVTVYGTCLGTMTYTSTMGGDITIPAVAADHIDISQ